MLKQLCLAGAAVALLSSTALAADYYIVQEKATKKCKVVDARPTETTWVQVGPLAFKTREEADRQVAVVCKEKK
jgi:IS4 transposase